MQSIQPENPKCPFFFHHRYRDDGPVLESLAVVEAHDDGYCTVAQFRNNGIAMPLMIAWSGCLTATTCRLNDEQRNTLREARKLSSIAAATALTSSCKKRTVTPQYELPLSNPAAA